MKKRVFRALLFTLIICSVLMLASCNDEEYEKSVSGIIYEQIGNTYTVVGYDGISGHVVIP